MFVQKDRQAVDTIDSYSRHLKAGSLSDNTIASRESVAYMLNEHLAGNHYLDLSTDKVAEVKGYMLDEWYQTLDISPASRNLYVGNIKAFFVYLVQTGYLEKDPSEILKKTKVIRNDDEDDEGDRLAYSIDDAVALINVKLNPSVDARDRAIVATLLAGGFRASELCSLNVGTYRAMKNGRMYVRRKGGAWKWIYVADYAVEFIDEYLVQRPGAKDEEPLFLSNEGNRFSRSTLYQRMKKRQKFLHLETGVHITRHTFLTEINRRNSLTVTQKLGAHSNSKTTEIYINPTKDELRDAANSVSWGKKTKREVVVLNEQEPQV